MFIENKISPNICTLSSDPNQSDKAASTEVDDDMIGTLLNDVLTPKLLNSPFATWSLINLKFLLPHTAHFDNIVFLPLLVFETLGFMFSVSFQDFNQYDLILHAACK